MNFLLWIISQNYFIIIINTIIITFLMLSLFNLFNLISKTILFYIIVSFRPIHWPWSHNSYKWVSTKFWCYYIKIYCVLANLIHNVDRFLIRNKEFYVKITTNEFRINYIEEISIKSDANKMKVVKYQKFLLFYIV